MSQKCWVRSNRKTLEMESHGAAPPRSLLFGLCLLSVRA